LAKNNAGNLLTSVDELFTTQAERDEAQREAVRDIPIAEISDFPDHPFQVRMDDEMNRMVESITEYGVMVPALVRPKANGGYEMIAGHRRKFAARQAGKTQLPCIVRELTDEEATIIMVDSNLQRETILPSEKAFAYKMKLDAMRRQGSRTDLTSVPVGQKLGSTSRELLADNSPDSTTQIQRYIRLTNLTPELLQLVDDGRMAMRPAVELSYLTEKEQQDLYELIELEECTPSHAQAIKMRKFSQMQQLTPEVILSILQETKPNQKEKFQIPRDRISKFFKPGTPAQNIEDTIVKALELYRKRQREQNR